VGDLEIENVEVAMVQDERIETAGPMWRAWDTHYCFPGTSQKLITGHREKTDLTGLVTGATFSQCMQYRYRLWRRWDPDRPKINFCMLNPSTADEAVNDPTVERCERRARSMGGGELIVTNLFAFRATDPTLLLSIDDPLGPLNGTEILRAAKSADLVICAWGCGVDLVPRKSDFRELSQQTANLLRASGIKLWCLGKTKAGYPRHPLYVSYKQQPEEF
jgi:hypothetical protein